MKIVIIIATHGRRSLLQRVVKHLESQTRPPDEVIISAPDPSDVGSIHSKRFRICNVFGRKGLTAQRNAALEIALTKSDIVTFFDDDFLPATDYLKLLASAFRDNPQWTVITGKVLLDGVKGPGLTFEEGLHALQNGQAVALGSPAQVSDHIGAYGCNMSVRSRQVGTLRFDERLPLYGWQEDTDFTSQLRQQGRVVRLSTLRGVHLGVKEGRVSGIRFGYSQIVNPVYLLRKGTVPMKFASNLIFRNIAANILRSFYPEPHVDRRGRLKGNCLAAFHLLQGRIEPEFILRL
jgi:GT2 family glycosyltransferase